MDDKIVFGDNFALFINGELVAEEQDSSINMNSDVLRLVSREKWQVNSVTQRSANFQANGYLSFRQDSKYNAADQFAAFVTGEVINVRLYDEVSEYAYAFGVRLTNHSVSTKIADFGRFSLQGIITGEVRLVVGVAPSLLTAMQDNTARKTINLAWTDTSTNETNVEVWRAQDDGQADELLAFELIATLAANTVSYTDSTCPLDGQQYAYKVRYKVGTNGFSDFSNIATASTLAAALTLTTTGDTSWLDVLLYAGATTTPEWERGSTSKLFVFANEHEYIREIYTANLLDFNQNAGVIGNVDLSVFPDLVGFVCPNQGPITLTPSEGLQTDTIDVTYRLDNSIITPSNAIPLILAFVIANGGTTTNNGTNYTGNAGFDSTGTSPQSREVNIGTLTFDLTEPEFSVAFQMVVALQAKGLIITTIITQCLKTLRIRTLDASFAVTTLEETSEVQSLVRLEGEVLQPKLYDTLANAQTGGATGLLATDVAAINNYLQNNTWAAGLRGIRFAAFDPLDTGNVSDFVYKAFPTDARACGAVIDVLGLPQFASYGLKLLRAGYSGALVRLIRVSDSVQADFYPNSIGELRWVDSDAAPSLGETNSLTTWIGGSSARVVTLYDQAPISAEKPVLYPCSAASAARRPLLDLTNRGIRATAQAQGLFYPLGSVPAWLSGEVKLSFAVVCQTLDGQYGFPVDFVAGLITTRNNVSGNIPFALDLPNNTLLPRVQIAKGPPATLRNLNNTMSKPTGKTVLIAARDATSLDIYRRGIDIAKNEVVSFVLNSVADNNYIGTGYELVIGSVQPSTATGASNGNVPFSSIIIYKNKLNATEVEAVAAFLNA